MREPGSALPIDGVLPELERTLAAHNRAVLVAPPGAGKSTRVPLALLDAAWLHGQRIVLLEPRRLAAQACARRMAAVLGERVGGRVGLRMRGVNQVGSATRIEVVTEAVLTRLMQTDSALPGVGLVLFDEFHERALEADLALALALEVQQVLREDLRLIVMSATLDASRVAALLAGAPVIESPGRSYPVAVAYRPRRAGERLEQATVRAVIEELEQPRCEDPSGDILVFLPGSGAIRRCRAMLEPALAADSAVVLGLYGDLPESEQERALAPDPQGRRRVILATSIAETSLTIDGVRVVIDSGYRRLPRFDPRTGMSTLETLPVAQAGADQRAGRAGRTRAGHCIRLWAAERALEGFDPPEIASADLSRLALELAAWGSPPEALHWLDPPPPASLDQARAVLRALGAIDTAGRITAHGRAVMHLPVHPRLGHMLLRAAALGLAGLGAAVAAVLGERDPLQVPDGPRPADLTLRLAGLEDPRALPPGMTIDHAARERIRREQHRLHRLLVNAGPRPSPGPGGHAPEPAAVGRLVALAYPDRLAMARAGQGDRFLLANGRGAALERDDALVGTPFLAVAALDGRGRDARIFLAAPLTRALVHEQFGDAIHAEAQVIWSGDKTMVLARQRERLGAMILDEQPLEHPDPDAVRAALIAGIRALGIESLPWTERMRQWRHRVAVCARLEPDAPWPEISDAGLLASLETWLAPMLVEPPRRPSEVDPNMLRLGLEALLTHLQRRRLETEVPERLALPSGRLCPIDYSGSGPGIAARIQELFGWTETPRLASGRLPITVQLLSPANRPVQTTQDLANFWRSTYFDVKRDLKGRYPKHAWPDDPLKASANAPGRGRR